MTKSAYFESDKFSLFFHNRMADLTQFLTQADKFAYFDDCLTFNLISKRPSLLQKFYLIDDAIISDELNHASIIDGIRLCKAKKFRYSHKNMKGKKQGSV